jgi:hypothetical protein
VADVIAYFRPFPTDIALLGHDGPPGFVASGWDVGPEPLEYQAHDRWSAWAELTALFKKEADYSRWMKNASRKT